MATIAHMRAAVDDIKCSHRKSSRLVTIVAGADALSSCERTFLRVGVCVVCCSPWVRLSADRGVQHKSVQFRRVRARIQRNGRV